MAENAWLSGRPTSRSCSTRRPRRWSDAARLIGVDLTALTRHRACLNAGHATVLAFDYGRRRIGVAVGQEDGSATLATVEVRHGRIDWTIGRLVETWQPDLFVLGCPATADGKPHPLAAEIARFARRLGGRYRREVALIDERLSSHAAHETAAPPRTGLDAIAAGLILESWFAHDAARRNARQ